MINNNPIDFLKKNSAWLMLLFLSAILSIISQFIEWVNNQSAWDLYGLAQYYSNFYVYFFPLLSGLLIILIELIFIFREMKYPIINSLIFIVILNLQLIFLIEAIGSDFKYVWAYPAIYFYFSAIICYFFGILIYFLSKTKDE